MLCNCIIIPIRKKVSLFPITSIINFTFVQSLLNLFNCLILKKFKSFYIMTNNLTKRDIINKRRQTTQCPIKTIYTFCLNYCLLWSVFQNHRAIKNLKLRNTYTNTDLLKTVVPLKHCFLNWMNCKLSLLSC